MTLRLRRNSAYRPQRRRAGETVSDPRTVIFSRCRNRCRMTGVWPSGAQVVPTYGCVRKTVSSRNTRVALSRRFFLICGQSQRIQCVITPSLRSAAFRLGFCGDQPKDRNSVGRYRSWYVTPNVRWISSPIRGAVQSWPDKPAASGPSLSNLSNSRRWVLVNLGTAPGLKYLNREGTGHWQGSVKLLNLSGTKVTDAGLGYLQGFYQLSTLNLASTGVTDTGLKHLKRYYSLKTLDLSNTEVTDAGLEHLKRPFRLRKLNLTGTRVTGAGIRNLARTQRRCKIHH